MQDSSQKTITIESDEEKNLLSSLREWHDSEGERLKRFLDTPDLSRTPGSPINEIVKRILKIPDFKDFEVVKVPEIVPARESFDLFNFPADHPARSKSDTYYINDSNILRTHTTIMWYYYLTSDPVKEKMARREPIGIFCHGKVYRKDEIDRNHMNVFHQFDGLLIVPRDTKVITAQDLQDVLVKIAKSIFGENINYRFNPDSFPYTDPSFEMEVQIPSYAEATEGKGGKWIEVLGSGLALGSVLEKLGVDSSVYQGWAFGFGLERLAIISMDLPDIRLLWSQDERVKKQLHLGNKFREVSKYPSITRDVSFIVKNNFVPNDYFDLIRDLGGDLVEQVELLDKYENVEKFGADRISYTYRIVYGSNERTLTTEEIDPIQGKIYNETVKQFKAEAR